MREILERNSFEAWAEIQRGQERTEWTVGDVKGVVAYFFKLERPLSQRTVYDIARTYSQILGVEVRTRKRRNFSEQVFTPEQVVEILQGINRKLNSTLSYAEAFLEMRQQKYGEESPVAAPAVSSGDSSEVLAELRSLRAEVAQLRGAGSSGESSGELERLRSEVTSLRSEVEQLRQEALTRTDLWRAAVAVVGLTMVTDEDVRGPLMAYLGIDAAELEVMRRFGVGKVGEPQS